MDKGAENHNWFSLSISEYIKDCLNAIGAFKEKKDRVLQNASNIEKKVLSIESAIIVREIDFDRKTPMDITGFSDFFESYRVKVLADLVKDYSNIGNIDLKSIEEYTVGSSSLRAEEMR